MHQQQVLLVITLMKLTNKLILYPATAILSYLLYFMKGNGALQCLVLLYMSIPI